MAVSFETTMMKAKSSDVGNDKTHCIHFVFLSVIDKDHYMEELHLVVGLLLH